MSRGPGVARKPAGTDGTAYAAPALEKGLDILELLCGREAALPQKEIARKLGRSVGELYRMIACLVERGYLVNIDDRFHVTTKLFELAHRNPPTHRLLSESLPLMQKLSADLDQSCHLTVYNDGRQIVVSKVDAPGGMGFSVRVGAELDVLVSASGRVLLAFQNEQTRLLRVEESLRRRPDHADRTIARALDAVRSRGFESIPSVQVRGLHAVSFPVLDTGGNAMAALTVPYAERIDQARAKPISAIEKMLGVAARTLSARMGGKRGPK
jgi:DNA-binding IclR family transcriptional regulator